MTAAPVMSVINPPSPNATPSSGESASMRPAGGSFQVELDRLGRRRDDGTAAANSVAGTEERDVPEEGAESEEREDLASGLAVLRFAALPVGMPQGGSEVSSGFWSGATQSATEACLDCVPSGLVGGRALPEPLQGAGGAAGVPAQDSSPPVLSEPAVPVSQSPRATDPEGISEGELGLDRIEPTNAGRIRPDPAIVPSAPAGESGIVEPTGTADPLGSKGGPTAESARTSAFGGELARGMAVQEGEGVGFELGRSEAEGTGMSAVPDEGLGEAGSGDHHSEGSSSHADPQGPSGPAIPDTARGGGAERGTQAGGEATFASQLRRSGEAPRPMAPRTMVEGPMRMPEPGTASVRLDVVPGEGGPVQVHVSLVHQTIYARVVTTQAEVQEFLNRNQSRLEAALQQQGLEMGQFVVDSGQQQSWRPPQDWTGREPRVPPSGHGPSAQPEEVRGFAAEPGEGYRLNLVV